MFLNVKNELYIFWCIKESRINCSKDEPCHLLIPKMKSEIFHHPPFFLNFENIYFFFPLFLAFVVYNMLIRRSILHLYFIPLCQQLTYNVWWFFPVNSQITTTFPSQNCDCKVKFPVEYTLSLKKEVNPVLSSVGNWIVINVNMSYQLVHYKVFSVYETCLESVLMTETTSVTCVVSSL